MIYVSNDIQFDNEFIHDKNRDETIKEINRSLRDTKNFPNNDIEIIGHLSYLDTISLIRGKTRSEILELITIYETKGNMAKWKSKKSGKYQSQHRNEIAVKMGNVTQVTIGQLRVIIKRQLSLLLHEDFKYKFNVVWYTLF